MDIDAPLAPPVVAVVVVHQPGTWFEEALEALADQDYPNLNTLFLLAGGEVDADGRDLHQLITARLPSAFVRPLEANPGYGAAANEVLRLVEGESGFFCFCHDDVALAPDAVRALVEELYRSNAGVVGPKLVEWDQAGVLQHVGLGMDRFGEIDPITEPGEYDQEQHDAVRDVFVVPSACLLIRADLFRTVGGFDESISYHGDDVDLCWRVHLSGARVVVAPQAVGRHLEQLEARRPELNHAVLRARHRMRSVASLTNGRRMIGRSFELVALTVAELVVGLFTGRFGDAWASLRALVGLVPRTPAIIRRRRAVATFRRVSDHEIIGLQNKGSARLTSYQRSRETATYVGEDASVRRWRESSLGTTLIGLIVVVGVLVASRTFIDARVPPVGEFLPLPSSAGDWWRDFTSGWNGNGLGATSPPPTGWAVLAAASLGWAYQMGLGLTVLVVGSILVGILGMWRLATVFPSNRSRVAALVVYAATPLLPGVISTGRLTALVGYAVLPWFVHLLRGALGIGTADPELADEELVDGILAPPGWERVRRTAVLAIVTAIALAIAPALAPVLVGTTIVLAAASLLAGAGVRTSAWFLGLGLAAIGAAVVLDLPWSGRWSWDTFAGLELAGAPDRGLVEVAAMDIGRARLTVLSLALYVPVLMALAVARSWRLTWAARAAGLVLVFGVLAVLQDRDALPFRLPDVGVLLTPVAVGLALAAAAAFAAFGDDVAGRSFGWRQPLALAALAGAVVGCTPVVFTVTDGAFFAPRSTLNEIMATYIGTDEDTATSDGRVLFLGDPRLMPVPPTDLGNGAAMAVIDDGPLDLRDRWDAADDELRDDLVGVVGDIAGAQTTRGGRLLAPFGVRYIVVPVVDGVSSTVDDPLPVPTGLIPALTNQLDLARVVTPSAFVVFENTAAMPTTALASGALAEASRADSLDVLVGLDPSAAAPALAGADAVHAADGELAPGTFLAGIAPDDHWRLEVGGEEVAGRSAFGTTTAYDIATGGAASYRYDPAGSRRLVLVGVGALWVVAFVLASRLRVPSVLRRSRERDETLLDLDREPGAADLTVLDAPGPVELGGWVEEMLAGHDPAPERPPGGLQAGPQADVGADDPSPDRPGGRP